MARADELDPFGSLWDWVAYDLRRYRTDHDLSQAEVARRLDVNRQAVHNYESGIRMLDVEQARKLDRLWGTGGTSSAWSRTPAAATTATGSGSSPGTNNGLARFGPTRHSSYPVFSRRRSTRGLC